MAIMGGSGSGHSPCSLLRFALPDVRAPRALACLVPSRPCGTLNHEARLQPQRAAKAHARHTYLPGSMSAFPSRKRRTPSLSARSLSPTRSAMMRPAIVRHCHDAPRGPRLTAAQLRCAPP
eukprot:1793781-Prymnesium_polylepis.2